MKKLSLKNLKLREYKTGTYQDIATKQAVLDFDGESSLDVGIKFAKDKPKSAEAAQGQPQSILDSKVQRAACR